MQTRAKFVCNFKSPDGQQISLSAVYTGSDENKQFFASTPGGLIQLNVLNPDAAATFEQGKEYYVDFTPA
ncbi:MAG: hypothetical protein KGL39_03020 [Patescibacteria group bacterium]|nr:hypothetical protein [Patescibacteria group bacterium]